MISHLKHAIVCSMLFSGIQSFGQTYCSPSYPSGCAVMNNRITNVQIGTLNHAPPNCLVHDYTNLSTAIIPGTPTALTVLSEGYCGVGAAVDFTHDGDFDDANEIMALPAYIPSQFATYSMNITIPVGTPSGNYRLRVYNRLANSGNGTPQDSPCGTYGYGSWDDYILNVGVYLGKDTSICAGEMVTLDAGGTTGATYLWNTGATSQTINVIAGGTYYVAVTNNNVIQTDTISITVNPLPVVVLGDDIAIVNGTSVTLNPGNPGSTYLWNTGAASQTLTVSSPGSYYVTVTDTNGCKGADTIIVTLKPVGINNINKKSESVTISPNPAKDVIHINSNESSLLKTKAILMDSYGRKIREIKIQSNEQPFSLSGLANGLYMLKLENGIAVKIVKE